jgi:hypothetical protein
MRLNVLPCSLIRIYLKNNRDMPEILPKCAFLGYYFAMRDTYAQATGGKAIHCLIAVSSYEAVISPLFALYNINRRLVETILTIKYYIKYLTSIPHISMPGALPASENAGCSILFTKTTNSQRK